MKLKPLLVSLLLASMMFGAVAVIPKAAALSPVIQTTSEYCQSEASMTSTLICTAFFGSPVSSADYMVAGWVMGNSTVASCITGMSCTLEDTPNIGLGYQDLTGGIVFSGSPLWGHLLVENLGTGGNAAFVNGNGVQFIFTFSNGEDITTEVNVYAIEVSELDPSGYECPGSSDCSASSLGGSYTMSPSNAGTDSSFLYVGFPAVANSASLKPSAGYTTIAPGAGIGSYNLNTTGQYKVSATAGGAISGTLGSSSSWLMVGEIFGISSPIATSTIQAVKITACNFFELQCWWEPLIFYGMYVGLWVGIGATMSIRARSMTYLFGAAVSYASMYLILLGELPYPFALMAFIGAFAYGLRLDGVF